MEAMTGERGESFSAMLSESVHSALLRCVIRRAAVEKVEVELEMPVDFLRPFLPGQEVGQAHKVMIRDCGQKDDVSAFEWNLSPDVSAGFGEGSYAGNLLKLTPVLG